MALHQHCERSGKSRQSTESKREQEIWFLNSQHEFILFNAVRIKVAFLFSQRRLEAVATQNDWQQDRFQHQATYSVKHFINPSRQEPYGISYSIATYACGDPYAYNNLHCFLGHVWEFPIQYVVELAPYKQGSEHPVRDQDQKYPKLTEFSRFQVQSNPVIEGGVGYIVPSWIFPLAFTVGERT